MDDERKWWPNEKQTINKWWIRRAAAAAAAAGCASCFAQHRTKEKERKEENGKKKGVNYCDCCNKTGARPHHIYIYSTSICSTALHCTGLHFLKITRSMTKDFLKQPNSFSMCCCISTAAAAHAVHSRCNIRGYYYSRGNGSNHSLISFHSFDPFIHIRSGSSFRI